MLLLCLLLFLLRQDESPPLVSMENFNSSTNKFVTYVEFDKAPSSSTLTRLHGCCSLFSVISMEHIMRKGDCLDAVGNKYSLIVFSQTTVIMDVYPRMEVTL